MINITEHIDSEKEVFKGIFFSVNRVDATLPDGNKAQRDVIRHPGAVAIVAMDDEGRILMERQYRTALDKVIFEIPAGKKEKGEAPVETAGRELAEETGYTSESMVRLGETILAAGYSDEIIEIFLAKGLKQGEVSRDNDEFLEMEFMEKEKIHRLIMNGTITDSKTIAAMYFVERMDTQ